MRTAAKVVAINHQENESGFLACTRSPEISRLRNKPEIWLKSESLLLLAFDSREVGLILKRSRVADKNLS